jgi:hypothetical protein
MEKCPIPLSTFATMLTLSPEVAEDVTRKWDGFYPKLGTT